MVRINSNKHWGIQSPRPPSFRFLQTWYIAVVNNLDNLFSYLCLQQNILKFYSNSLRTESTDAFCLNNFTDIENSTSIPEWDKTLRV